MPDPPPDEALLRRFLLGELSGPERERVAAYLDRHPEVAATAGRPAPDEMAVDARALLKPAERPGDLGRLGRYRVLRVLGRGGTGVVFEAEDDALKRRVALKAIRPTVAADPAFRQRFAREAAAAAKVEHDNIAPVYDVAETDGALFLAMPLLLGETLDARLKARGSLPAPEVLAIGRQVAEGLAAAHAAGLIHRDIKPANIWLERTPAGAFPRARILDFGLARSIGGAGLTDGGAVVGTPAYMAPEQARGQKVDHRADLFSLGCVLYQMATGLRPFSGADALAVLSALANDMPPAPREVNPAVPAALSALIELLLSKDPAHRWPATAQEVADELFRIANDPLGTSGVRPGLAAPPVGVAPAAQAEVDWFEATAETEDAPTATDGEPRPAPRRRRARVFVACAVLVAALALAGYYSGTIIRIATDLDWSAETFIPK